MMMLTICSPGGSLLLPLACARHEASSRADVITENSPRLALVVRGPLAGRCGHARIPRSAKAGLSRSETSRCIHRRYSPAATAQGQFAQRGLAGGPPQAGRVDPPVWTP
jgi:hypothetical protein